MVMLPASQIAPAEQLALLPCHCYCALLVGNQHVGIALHHYQCLLEETITKAMPTAGTMSPADHALHTDEHLLW